jgi:hypothetical protein
MRFSQISPLVTQLDEVVGNAFHSGVAVSGIDRRFVSRVFIEVLCERGRVARVAVYRNDEGLLGGVDATASSTLLEEDVLAVAICTTLQAEELHAINGDARRLHEGEVVQALLNVLYLLRLRDVVAAVGPVAAVSGSDNRGAVHVSAANEAVINVRLPGHFCGDSEKKKDTRRDQ